MMGATRLDSVAPLLAESFRQASSAKRRQAVLLACERAVTSVGLTTPEACEAVDVLRNSAYPHPSLGARLARLADEFDDEYLRLFEDDDPDRRQDALQTFSKARAMSALAFALCADETQLHEVIYEAMTAMNDPTDLTDLVSNKLSS